MKSNRRSAIVLATVVGLAGVGVGTVVGPTVASAASSSADPSVGGRLAAIKQALAGLVQDGTINQSQADKVADTLDTNLSRGGGPGRGGHLGAGPDALATAIGITPDALRAALEAGKTPAQVAKDKGIDQDTLVSRLVTAAKAQLAEEVTAGRLTQAQADQLTTDLKARITDQVTRTRPAGGPGGPGGHDGRFGGGRPGGPEGRSGTTPPSSSPSTSPSSSPSS